MGLFCEHKDALGKPGEGFHASRIGPFAAGDLIATIIVAIIIAIIWNVNILLAFGGLFVAGALLHWAFCVDTAFMKMIGLSNDSDSGDMDADAGEKN
jgi:hypothetical protein